MIIRDLIIGSKHFRHNLIQGPLAGYSCAPFRKLFYRYAAPAYCVTEMISAYDLVYNRHRSMRYLWRDPVEEQLCYQLSGNCPVILSEAVKIVTDAGADLIDLNCGCPKSKIRKKHCGSYLLAQPTQIARLVAAMKSSTNVPVTVKIRVDGASQERYHLAVGQLAAEAGADALIVHGRHWNENYDSPCHLDQIRELVEAVNIPVIGNGDVCDLNSLQNMLQTGCAGVMISRAGTGRPWLFHHLLQQMRGEQSVTPALPEVIDLFTQHLTDLIKLTNQQQAHLESRKLLQYYFPKN
ncbi:MAG: tRNA-dihydrouridine synthase family protein [Proteobacteria bacterium]|nr:tRNA-dihydrouridine synthase family protein [Pseudomonadota bacterium]